MKAMRRGHADYACLRTKNKDVEDQVVGMNEPGIHSEFSSKAIAALWLIKSDDGKLDVK